MSLAAMPCILVVLTMGYLCVIHLGHFLQDGSRTERGLEADYLEASAAQVQKPLTRVRARLGLLANDVVQREGELYYLPDIEHVVGRSFLREAGKNDHVVLRRREEKLRARNPLPSILDFDRQLRAREIQLVLLPTPSKAMFAAPGKKAIDNAGFEEFLEAMQKNEVPVFDLRPHFADYQERGHDLFLKTDSHWTPEAMRLSAILLTAFLEREDLRPDGQDELLHGATKTITNSGDLAILLKGGPSARWQETIAVHPLRRSGERRSEGSRWRPDPDSPLLLLGDSFTNVFSLAEMGWGEDAGLAEALSQCLGVSVDRLARNADGAFASRQALQQNADRLEGKTVVVWQFAARELSFGDWKALPLPEIKAGPIDADLWENAVELEGTIAQVAKVPPLTRAPYRRAVMEVRLVAVVSDAAVPEGVVLHGLGVRDRKPTAMTKWKAGDKLKVKVVPWRKVAERYGRLHRFALDDPEFELIDAARFWIVE